MEELESMLLETPYPALDSSVMRWILEEGEEGALSIQGSVGSDHHLRAGDPLLRVAQAAAPSSTEHLLLPAPVAIELPPRAPPPPPPTQLLPPPPATASAWSELLPRAVTAASDQRHHLPAASGSIQPLHHAMEIQLYNHGTFPSPPPPPPQLHSPTAFSKSTIFATPRVLHPYAHPHSATIPRDLEPLHFEQPKPIVYLPCSGSNSSSSSIMPHHPPIDGQILPFSTENSTKPQLLPPCLSNHPLLSSVYGNSPAFMAKNNLPGAPFTCQRPSSSSESLLKNDCSPLPSVPYNHAQQTFTQQNMLHQPLDGNLEKSVQWQHLRSEPAWQAMQKSTGDPLPRPKQEFPVKLQDRFFSLDKCHIQLPELQWVQRGNVSSDEGQLTAVNQLLKAAEAVELGNTGVAQAILARLNQHLSPQSCNPLQRAAFYFREALARRVAGLGPPPQNRSPIEIINKIGAFKNYCEISPIPQFAHFTANQAILEAMEGEDCIHLIDFEIGFGGQWASFFQEIALRPGGPPKVRITTVGLESMEMQLASGNLNQFARSLNISLEFQVVSLAQLECLTTSVFQLREGEAVALNFAFVLNRFLTDFSSADLFTALLHLLKELSPKVITVVDHVLECDGTSVFHYFQNNLHSYADLFDSLESSRLDMEAVHTIERHLFAPKIAALVDCSGKRKERSSHNLLQGAGFSIFALSATAEAQADYLMLAPNSKGFNVVKDHGTLLLEWQGRHLVCASSWV